MALVDLPVRQLQYLPFVKGAGGGGRNQEKKNQIKAHAHTHTISFEDIWISSGFSSKTSEKVPVSCYELSPLVFTKSEYISSVNGIYIYIKRSHSYIC